MLSIFVFCKFFLLLNKVKRFKVKMENLTFPSFRLLIIRLGKPFLTLYRWNGKFELEKYLTYDFYRADFCLSLDFSRVLIGIPQGFYIYDLESDFSYKRGEKNHYWKAIPISNNKFLLERNKALETWSNKSSFELEKSSSYQRGYWLKLINNELIYYQEEKQSFIVIDVNGTHIFTANKVGVSGFLPLSSDFQSMKLVIREEDNYIRSYELDKISKTFKCLFAFEKLEKGTDVIKYLKLISSGNLFLIITRKRNPEKDDDFNDEYDYQVKIFDYEKGILVKAFTPNITRIINVCHFGISSVLILGTGVDLYDYEKDVLVSLKLPEKIRIKKIILLPEPWQVIRELEKKVNNLFSSYLCSDLIGDVITFLNCDYKSLIPFLS
jgi:hypothetical protein